MSIKGIDATPDRAETRRAMSHDQIMEGNIKEMADSEIARAIEVMLNRYIPNLEATFQHPMVIDSYRARLGELMDEYTARNNSIRRRLHGAVKG